MGKAFLYGNGGASPLNFKVVGGTAEPASPAENMIWVNTDAEITGWIFSAEEPVSPEVGVVWIKTGLSGNVAFNALKKNGILLCPLIVKQYVQSSASEWVSKTAKTYRDGSWVDWWDGSSLYNSGDEIVQATGGWSPQAFKASNDVGNLKAPTVKKNADSMKVDLAGYSGDAYYCGCLMTEYAVDLTGFTSLKIHISAITSAVNLRVASAKSSGYTSDASLKIDATGDSTLDISSISGEKYIAIAIAQANASVTFDKIWLE